LGLPTWSAQITRSGAVPNDEANDQVVVQAVTSACGRAMIRRFGNAELPAA
jgi:hypothetical protein